LRHSHNYKRQTSLVVENTESKGTVKYTYKETKLDENIPHDLVCVCDSPDASKNTDKQKEAIAASGNP